jgi:hypothetical protein
MSNRKLELVTVVLIFTILGLVYTYPLVLYFNKGMAYTHSPAKGYEVVSLAQGDYLQFYYKLWLFKDSVLGPTPLFSDPYQFSISEEKTFSTQSLPLSFFFLIFSAFGGNFAYNSLVILSFTLSGLAMYLLVKFYTEDRLSAFLGGLIFALAPYRLAQVLGGHPNGFLFFLIPLAIYFLEISLSKKSVKYGIFSGLSILSLAFLELHLIYYLSLFLGLFILLKLFLSSEEKRGWWKGLLPIFLFIFVSLVWLFSLRSGLSASIVEQGRTLHEVRLYSPKIGDIFKRGNIYTERYIYLGIIPLFLGIFGLFSKFSPLLKRYHISRIFYGVVLSVTFLLSLGPNLRQIPLYKFCYRYIPFFNYPRVPGRIIVLTFLSLSILAGFGIRRIRDLKLKKGVEFFILGIFSLGILIDYYPSKVTGISLTERRSKVYEIVRRKIGDYRLLELPIWPGDTAWSSLYLYQATRTRVRMINGYSPAVSRDYVENIFRPLHSLDFGEMREEQYKLLKKLKVKYIIMHEEAYPPKVSPYPASLALDNLKESKYLKFIEYEDPLWLFELLDKPSQVFPQKFSHSSVMGVLYEGEKLPRRIGKRMPDSQASGGEAVFADASIDEEDYLVFGPYRTFPSGKYKAFFKLKIEDNKYSREVARIDITTNKGRTVLSQKLIRGSDFDSSNLYQDIALPFASEESQRLEFRIYFYKKVNLWADCIYLLFAGQGDPQFSYEAEDLFHMGRVKPDASGSAQKAVLGKLSKDPEDYLIWGPRRKYPEGSYTISFRLKTGDLVEEEVARIEVTAERKQRILASRAIRGTDFKDRGTYQEFELSFSLETPTVLEFPVYYKKKADLWVDKFFITAAY